MILTATMSADENDAPASTELTSGDIAAPDVNTEHAQSKPEVASSDHVTDGTSSPQSGDLLCFPFYYRATLLRRDDCLFVRFYTTPICDRQTDRRTDGRTPVPVP